MMHRPFFLNDVNKLLTYCIKGKEKLVVVSQKGRLV